MMYLAKTPGDSGLGGSDMVDDQSALFTCLYLHFCIAELMARLNNTLTDSPDPLAISQDSVSQLHQRSPSKKQSPIRTPRKALSSTSGNAQIQDFYISTPSAPGSRANSPIKSQKSAENNASPWRIRVTVQAEHGEVPQSEILNVRSPSKTFTERKTTTIVPLKGLDDSSPVGGRKARGRPKKSLDSPVKRNGTPKPRAITRRKTLPESPTKSADARNANATVPPKKAQGRPRKSQEPNRSKSGQRQSNSEGSDRDEAKVKTRRRKRSPQRRAAKGKVTKLDKDESDLVIEGAVNISDNEALLEETMLDPNDGHRELDSVIESEGFSMVSVSSLSSAQRQTTSPGELDDYIENLPGFGSGRKTTPSIDHSSLTCPPPLPLAVVATSPRALDRPTNGTPKLARVVRAGIALQGVLSPADQRRFSTSCSSTGSPSPKMSSKSPKQRLDHLFSGFGPATQRELRAGLRLGEELAKRQNNLPRLTSPDTGSNEDIFSPPNRSNRSNALKVDASVDYSLNLPDSRDVAYPSLPNNQLLSPAESVAGNDDLEEMDWKVDSPPQDQQPPIETTSHEKQTTSDKSSFSLRMKEQEADWQREREAVIENIDVSQMIIIDSDREDEASSGDYVTEDGDIWQEEAQSSHSREPTPEISQILLQNATTKPRRSQIPSPWVRKFEDVADTKVTAPNDSDLFWQPNQTKSQTEDGMIRNQSKVQDFRRSFTSSNLKSSEASHDFAHKLDKSYTVPIETKVSENEDGIETTSRSRDLDSQLVDGNQKSLRRTPETEAKQASVPQDLSIDYPDQDDEEAVLPSQLSVFDGLTGPLDESSEVGFSEPDSPIQVSSRTSQQKDQAAPAGTTTPTPSKHIRFSAELARPTPKSIKPSAPPAAPLPPTSNTWLSRLTSFLPTWGTSTSAAAIPLPSSPKKIIELSKLDQGPLPLYMPWLRCHWWALINLWNRSQKDPSAYPYNPSSGSLLYSGTNIKIRGWVKKITKQDLSIVDAFMAVLAERGTTEGIVQARKKKKPTGQWGRMEGDLIDVQVVVSHLVAHWAQAVQEGECELGKGDQAGLRLGSEKWWTKADLPVDGPRRVWV